MQALCWCGLCVQPVLSFCHLFTRTLTPTLCSLRSRTIAPDASTSQSAIRCAVNARWSESDSGLLVNALLAVRLRPLTFTLYHRACVRAPVCALPFFFPVEQLTSAQTGVSVCLCLCLCLSVCRCLCVPATAADVTALPLPEELERLLRVWSTSKGVAATTVEHIMDDIEGEWKKHSYLAPQVGCSEKGGGRC